MPRFFTALNPLLPEHGIDSTLIINDDLTVAQIIEIAWKDTWRDKAKPLSFLDGIVSTFQILIGNHYQYFDLGTPTYKGALDFLILPLLARVLICNNHPDEGQDKKPVLQKTVEWSMAIFIALPIEIVRFTVAMALTIALTPVVALVHIAKNIWNCIQPCIQQYETRGYRM